MIEADPAATFRQEAAELLEQLEAALLDLKCQLGDADLVNKAFRALHTIKGSGAMFGFEQVAAFAHEFESAFDRVRKGQAAPDPELIAIALNAKDYLRAQIEKPDETSAVIGECILSDLRKLTEGGLATVPVDPRVAAPANEPRTWRIGVRFNKDVLINGSNPLLLLEELRGLGECRIAVNCEATPPLPAMDPASCYFSWEVWLTTAHPRSAIEDVFVFVRDETILTIEEQAATPPAVGCEVLPASTPAERPADSALSKKPSGKDAATVRVQADRLDEMMDRVGELVIAQARLSQLATAGASTKGVAEEIGRLASALRDAVTGIRMLPIGSLFGRFRRLIHDLSHDLKKEIELVTEGEETELDKTMIERLADPLIHVIRNAADHGLESPEARLAAGKSSVGRIRLVARHAGAEVQISVSDDGRGLDPRRIRGKAEESGLIAAGAAMTDSDLYQLIFQPGFSTAKEVSSISGRGVGLDVVRRALDGLRGSIDIASEPGKGTTFTLRLPLTLAIIEGLLVRVAETRYVIPLTAVEECVELTNEAQARSKRRSFLNIRGGLVPFLRLRELFADGGDPDPHQKVVIVANAETRIGLVVDQIIGSHQIVIKSLSKLHADVPSFSGATILGDGAVALILDVPHLIAAGQAREARLQAKNLEAA
jgi:two-component system chemotaxis sensor kinase CheA